MSNFVDKKGLCLVTFLHQSKRNLEKAAAFWEGTAEGLQFDFLSLMSFLFALSALANNLHSFSPRFLDMLLYISVAFTVLKNKIILLLIFFSLHCCLNPQWPITCGRVALTWAAGAIWRTSEVTFDLSLVPSILVQCLSLRDCDSGEEHSSQLDRKFYWMLNQFVNTFLLSLFLPFYVRGFLKNQNPASRTALPLLNNWIFKLWLWCLRRLCGFEIVIIQ